MKSIFLALTLLLSFSLFGQLPYSWSPGVDPGWTSSNSGNGPSLDWQNGCNVVAVNCGGYSNNQNTSYTSPVIDASCNNASTILISFNISGQAEAYPDGSGGLIGYDFLFMEYSTDGGGTWTNFYGPNMGLTGNAGAGATWTLPPIPATNNLMFRFTFDSDFIVTSSGYQITDLQIICNVQLPVELTFFDGEQIDGKNVLEWETASEINSDYFELERSYDGYYFEHVATVDANGTTNQVSRYKYVDEDFTGAYDVIYYNLKQFDFNGDSEEFNIISIENEVGIFYVYSKQGDENIYISDSYKFELYNMMGQLVFSGEGNVIVTDSIQTGMYILKVGSYKQKVFVR